MYLVETKRQCERCLAKLKQEGYTVWQTQFGTYAEKGYHVWFWKSGHIIELYTHDPEIEDMMQRYTQK